jgi:hypothetical protein
VLDNYDNRTRSTNLLANALFSSFVTPRPTLR